MSNDDSYYSGPSLRSRMTRFFGMGGDATRSRDLQARRVVREDLQGDAW
jgi:hypothetical protein